MRGRGRGKGGVISTDLLACFPSRGHLALMPNKPVSSPSRATGDPPKRQQLQLSRLSGVGRGVGGLVGTPRLLRSRTARRKALSAPPPPPSASSTELVSEPSSPKVTCAGQIKVGRQCGRRNQAVSSSRKSKWKRPNWMGALGIKREILHLLTGAVRGLRLNSGCFGRNIPCNGDDCTSDDEEEDEEEVEEAERRAGVKAEKEEETEAATAAGAALSRWFTVLENSKSRTVPFPATDHEDEEDEETESPKSLHPGVPPPNALLLMRCRSAPTRGRFRDVNEDEEDDGTKTRETTTASAAAHLEITKAVSETTSMEAGRDTDLEKVVLRPYAPDVFKVLSTEVAQETWVAGPDPLMLRCRSWRR